MLTLFLLAAPAEAAQPAVEPSEIVVTASRAPQDKAATPASVTIIDAQRIEGLGEPMLPALLRLTPSASVSVSGPAGSFSEVRIRGAEANHTLLFVDGIRANDPAAGNAPRFELLNADLVSRIEIVRGPQSALWGSEAIGGVVAVTGRDDGPGVAASAEGGSFGVARATASASMQAGGTSLSGAIGGQRASGIDSFDGTGDKDGYRNRSARLRATTRLGDSVVIGAASFALRGTTQFDGYDPVTFDHADTLDTSRNRLAAGRAWAQYGSDDAPWRARIGASLLGSRQYNALDGDPINRTRGRRRTFEAQAEHRFATGAIDHALIAAIEDERETFRSRDDLYGGATNQDRNRNHRSLTAQWRAELPGITADVAVRRDRFSRFADATSIRAGLLGQLGDGVSLAGSYAEGIAQPTFFDLYGFFPGSFVGNASLKPESSRGFELSARYRKAGFEAALTGYRQRLHDEIVDVFDFATFLSTTVNRDGTSRRSGVEAEAALRLSPALRLSATYAWLDATQPDPAGTAQLRELRRPKHSGSLAMDGASGRWSYGASAALVGSHIDRRESAPYDLVTLKRYALVSARIAYAVNGQVQLFVRASNLLDSNYRDAVEYRTEGRGLFAGISLAGGRRSSP